MAISSTGAASRAVAARCIDDVLNHGISLDAAFEREGVNELDERDQSFVRAQSYGAIRLQLRNAALLELLLDKPLKQKDSILGALLSVGLYALQESQRPDYAVVSATVSAADKLGRRRLRGFINAILRRFLRERDELLARVAEIPQVQTLHPQWLTDAFKKDWPEQWPAILEANNKQAPMWLRVNQQRVSPDDFIGKLQEVDIAASSPVASNPGAVLLEAPQPVTGIPGFADGDCSVQDVSSQLVAQLLGPEFGQRLLDACAAPGGKTCHLVEQNPDLTELVALERSPERLERITANLTRLGLKATVLCGDALDPESWWDETQFDRILIDAPCSATGVIRRHPDIRFLRRSDDIAALANTQQEMLRRLWPLLRPGGRLLYTTCSVLRQENENIIAGFLAEQTDAREIQISTEELAVPTVASSHGVQLLPDTFGNDGFYYALLERD